ncbi:hypothetical protein GH733_007869 [Mirounga leonina]|nr:hypothetical protein GH733_007869 [Mirounga leonina]
MPFLPGVGTAHSSELSSGLGKLAEEALLWFDARWQSTDESRCEHKCDKSSEEKNRMLRSGKRGPPDLLYGRNSFTDILRAILLSLEVLIEDPELQINGFILIIDWSNFSFKQASKLTPSILKLAIEGLQDSFPARFGGVHFVNQPWYIHALYTLIKPFLKDKTRKRIFLHGNNLNSLHQLIHPEFLPSEFGGTLPPYDMGTWARTLLGPDYSDENDYTHTSYNAMHVKHTSSNLERECSPKPMKRSQSVVEAGTLKHEEKGENENTQPLLALD